MGMKAPVTGQGDYPAREVPPTGNYLAVCNGVYMLGTQPGFEGGDARLQVMLSFELHKRKGPVLDSQGRIFEASAIMNLSANVKSILMEYAGALRGRTYDDEELKGLKDEGGFDVEGLVGKSCRVEIEHKKKADGTIKDKIKGVSSLDPDDDQPPKSYGDEVYWDWTLGAECPRRIAFFWDRAPENPDRGKRVQKAAAYAGAGVGTSGGAADNDGDDIPF